MAKKNRWEQESRDFIEALTGGADVSVRKPGKDDTRQKSESEQRLDYIRRTAGGRPRRDSPVTDPLMVYNFKVRRSTLEELRSLSGRSTRTIRDLMEEAISDLLVKYK